ncbi:MAG: N-acetyltransferase family protein [Stellaceae bacterium]
MRSRAEAAPAFRLRDAEDADMAGIAEIYAHHVRFGLGSFEEEPPGVEELQRRRREVLARLLPYLAAIAPDGTVLGYAYAAPYRTRSAYRYSVEDSIYSAPAAGRRGVGQALLAALIERCTTLGYRQMVAVIGDSGNLASIGLHERLGFHRVGLLPAIGYKHASWVDNVLMQRALGSGAAERP